MALAVADVAAALLDALGPGIEVELAVQVDVATAQADALAVDAGEVRLATDARAVAAVEGVVPGIQLPDRRRVYRRDEVAHAVGHVHQVLVGADAVHRRHRVAGQVPGWADVEAPAAVRKAD